MNHGKKDYHADLGKRWRWAFAFLAPGPIIGILAMLRLKSLPEAAKISGGKG